MPKASRQTAPETVAFDGLDVRLEHLAGLFRGLPDDHCQTIPVVLTNLRGTEIGP